MGQLTLERPLGHLFTSAEESHLLEYEIARGRYSSTTMLRLYLILVLVSSPTLFGAKRKSRRKCLLPPHMQNKNNEFCPTPFVPKRICHAPTSCRGNQDGSDVCSVVAHALLADFEIFDVVFLHSGLCQSEIRSGDLTREDVEKILPYNEELVAIQLNGSDLLAALEHGLDQFYSQRLRDAITYSSVKVWRMVEVTGMPP